MALKLKLHRTEMKTSISNVFYCHLVVKVDEMQKWLLTSHENPLLFKIKAQRTNLVVLIQYY